MPYDPEYEQAIVLLRARNVAAEESRRAWLPSFVIDVVSWGFLLVIICLMATAPTWMTLSSWHEFYASLRGHF